LKSLLVGLDLISALLEEILLALALLKLFVETLTQLLLPASLVTHTSNLRFYLQDFIILLFDQLLDRLKCFVSLLHSEESLLPVLKEGLLAHNDFLDFDSSLFQGVAGSCCFLFLRDKLRLIQSLLLI
jgi:hypothetical protein